MKYDLFLKKKFVFSFERSGVCFLQAKREDKNQLIKTTYKGEECPKYRLLRWILWTYNGQSSENTLLFHLKQVWGHFCDKEPEPPKARTHNFLLRSLMYHPLCYI